MKPIMFFDGGCPLCQREVAHYRALDRKNRVSWIDISREARVLEEQGIALDAAMKRLHALDEQGRVVSGAAAFVAVWRQLPVYRHLAWLVERSGMVPFLDRVYMRFEGRKAGGEDVKGMAHAEIVEAQGQSRLRFMKAIPTAGVCLVCHGETIADDVASAIDKGYPTDLARGYKLDDIRGAFSLSKPHSTDTP